LTTSEAIGKSTLPIIGRTEQHRSRKPGTSSVHGGRWGKPLEPAMPAHAPFPALMPAAHKASL
jgi:hypothetical protein